MLTIAIISLVALWIIIIGMLIEDSMDTPFVDITFALFSAVGSIAWWEICFPLSMCIIPISALILLIRNWKR